jgi:hypothetical protein
MKHIFRSFFIALCLLTGPPRALFAQEATEPFLEVEMAETSAIPGQMLDLRVTVMVPTWLAQPIDFPSFEAPNLMVRLSEKSTTPTSRNIGGETWSGVSRLYRMSPMIAGRFAIPAQDVRVLWADPGQTDPNETLLQTDPIALEGIVPEGAEGLDPFIAAQSLELAQEIVPETDVLKPGEGISRTVTANISGISPIYLPEMLTPGVIEGVAAYPAEPRITETEDRGVISGTRTEKIEYLAQSGGEGELPAVEIVWYNLETGTVETARLDPVTLNVDGPKARAAPRLSPAQKALLSLAVLLGLAVLLAALRWISPRIAQTLQERQARKLASEGHAFRLLQKAIGARDYAATLQALDLWAGRSASPDPRQEPSVVEALAALGATRYAVDPGQGADPWGGLAHAMSKAREARAASHSAHSELRALNPT